MRIVSAAMIGVVTSLFVSTACAGTYMESVQSLPATQGKTPAVAKTWLDKGRYRVDMPNGKVQIFKDRTFFTVDNSKKTYSKMTEADLKATFAQADAATKALRDMLPQKDREELEKKAAARAKGNSEYARTLKATARTEKTPLGACKVWEALVQGQKVQELCVIPLASVPNSTDFVATMKESDSMMNGTPAAGAMGAGGWSDLQTTQGFPVITRMIIPGQGNIESKVMAIRSAPTPDSLFAIPKDYRETKDMIGGPSL